MDRNAYREESGTDQPDTYWRRRVLTLAAGLALLGLLAWAFSGGGGKPAQHPSAAYGSASASSSGTSSSSGAFSSGSIPSASPAADASTGALDNRVAAGLPATRKTPSSHTPFRSVATLPGVSTARPASQPHGSVEPGGGCAPDAVVLSLFTSKTSYSWHQDPKFSIYAVSTGSHACTFAMGPAKLQVIVMSSGRIIWDSSDCARGPSARSAELKRGVPAQETVSWNRSVSLPGCVTLASSAPAGTYQVQARNGSVSSPVRTFKLARLGRQAPQNHGEGLPYVFHLLYFHRAGRASSRLLGALQGRA
jgi:hypothetical protein